MKRSNSPILILLFILMAFLATSPATAQDTTSTYTGVDLLFLVDQSGSMGGAAFGSGNSAGNDPLNLRFESVQYALSTLSTYKDTLSEDITLRMAVLNFGDIVEPALTWTDIQTSRDVEWQQLQPQLESQLSASTFGSRNLGNTDFISAIEEAQRQFRLLDANPDENHIRSIIILTDGAPCAPERFTDPNCGRVSDQTQHMQELISLTRSAFPSDNYRIYTIAVDNNNSFWGSFESDWQAIVSGRGNAQRVENSTEASSEFLNIMVSLVNEIRASSGESGNGNRIGENIELDPLTNTSPINVPPYYQRMRVTVFKLQQEAGVVLTTPSGITMSQASPQVTVTGLSNAIEVWTIDNPEPGNWQLQSITDSNVTDVVLDLIQVNYTINIENSLKTRYVPIELVIELQGSTGDPLPQYTNPAYNLQFDTTYTSPSGTVHTVTFADPINSIYTATIVPEEAGTYDINLRAFANDANGNSFDLINRAPAATFDVGEITADFTESPTGDILISQEKTVSGQLLTADDTLLNLPNLTVNAVIGQSGNQPQTLTIPPQDDGSYSLNLNQFNEAGQYQITIEVIDETLPQPIPIVQERFNAFNVSTANIVGITLENPTNDSTLYQTGWWPRDERPVTMTLRTTDENGNRIAVENLTDDNSIPIAVSLVQTVDDVPTTIYDSIAPQAVAGEVGAYQLVWDDLPNGDYSLSVIGNSDPMMAQATLFDPRFIQQSQTFALRTNPMLIVFWAVSGVLSVLIVAGVVWFTVRTINSRKHPAKGRLEILSESDSFDTFSRSSDWSHSLDRYRSNRITITQGLNRFDIKRIEVQCPNDRMSERGQVNVAVYYKGGRKDARTLGKGGEMRLRNGGKGGDLILAKDPNEDEGF